MSYTYKATFSMCHCETVEVDLKDWYDTTELDNMTEEELEDKIRAMAWHHICDSSEFEPEELIEIEKEV